ncbi:hypothetical protein PGTUg99_004385 [Puccinia graminis f. sp. tritici]|uniref:No apical meristem-associated C-terminal domain-containing protein n=1 Tax=Puccinia graminis f. sp. tritici TaxID=56615 RepID=A0A5B0PDZ7_PUCGR|nr:hypothetical protein PGTUg99_004385 [Puccinia graminis f. sp. tritici]
MRMLSSSAPGLRSQKIQASGLIKQPPRPIGSIKGRWQLISHGVTKLTGCVKHIDRLNASGATSEDCLTQALSLFAKLQGKTFTFLRCYNILLSSPKWTKYFQDLEARHVDGSKKKKKRARSLSSEAPPLNSGQTSNTETPTETPSATPVQSEPKRPVGKKKAKAFVQEATQEARIMKDMALAQAEIASQSKRQNDIYQSQTQTMQTMANTAIMNKDLSGLDEVTQEFYRLQREQIILKLREQSREAQVERARAAAEGEQAGASSSITQATQSNTQASTSTSTSIDLPQSLI